MKDSLFTIIENDKTAKSVYKMLLRGDTSAIINAGEFVNIQLDYFYLRRALTHNRGPRKAPAFWGEEEPPHEDRTHQPDASTEYGE